MYLIQLSAQLCGLWLGNYDTHAINIELFIYSQLIQILCKHITTINNDIDGNKHFIRITCTTTAQIHANRSIIPGIQTKLGNILYMQIKALLLPFSLHAFMCLWTRV